jgi:hypothetical protein
MDRRTVITLGIILAVIIGAFSFLIFNPGARQAMQKSLDASTSQAAKDSGIDIKSNQGR